MELVCHPSSATGAVERITVAVHRTARELGFEYRLEGDGSRIRIPAVCAPARTLGLWKHTCFEAFVAIEGEPAYHEFNVSPSGEWAVHAFRG